MYVVCDNQFYIIWFLHRSEISLFSILDTNHQKDMNRGLCIRRTLWEDTVKKCHGVMKNYNCNLALADLPEVFEKRCLFINKFSINVDGTVISCLHHHLTNIEKSR